jgi:hypothetical protein
MPRVCRRCDDVGGWCSNCGTHDCAEGLPECNDAEWITCPACDGSDEPEHVAAELPAPTMPPDLLASADLANELQHVRGELARAQRSSAEQSHVSLCTAATLERAQQALTELRDAIAPHLQAALLASIPYTKLRANIALARAQLVSGHCAHTPAPAATPEKPGSVIELRKAVH